jgi:hypothetical protein
MELVRGHRSPAGLPTASSPPRAPAPTVTRVLDDATLAAATEEVRCLREELRMDLAEVVGTLRAEVAVARARLVEMFGIEP